MARDLWICHVGKPLPKYKQTPSLSTPKNKQPLANLCNPLAIFSRYPNITPQKTISNFDSKGNQGEISSQKIESNPYAQQSDHPKIYICLCFCGGGFCTVSTDDTIIVLTNEGMFVMRNTSPNLLLIMLKTLSLNLEHFFLHRTAFLINKSNKQSYLKFEKAICWV